MNNTIQIQSRGESYEALATALGHIVLKFLTMQINCLLAFCAIVCIVASFITGQHITMTVVCVMAWICHLAVMLCISIAKGGDQL